MLYGRKPDYPEKTHMTVCEWVTTVPLITTADPEDHSDEKWVYKHYATQTPIGFHQFYLWGWGGINNFICWNKEG